jgi:hypothetical protein
MAFVSFGGSLSCFSTLDARSHALLDDPEILAGIVASSQTAKDPRLLGFVINGLHVRGFFWLLTILSDDGGAS